MPETAPVLQPNLSHNVPALLNAAKTSLTDLAKLHTLRMQVGLWLIERKNRRALAFIQLNQQMFDKRPKQENHRKALHALPVFLQREPTPVRLVTEDNFGFGEKVP